VVAEAYFETLGQDLKKSTIRGHETTLYALRAEVGDDIQPRNITVRHIDAVSLTLKKTNGKRAMNNHQSRLVQFFTWCQDRRIVPLSHNPMKGRKARKFMDPERFMLQVAEFPALLRAAPTPRDRGVIATGLLLLLRASEIRTLRIKDLDLINGTMNVKVWKTNKRSRMSIPVELDRELRRWLTQYTQQIDGPLKPTYYLFPGRKMVPLPSARGANGQFVKGYDMEEVLAPSKPIGVMEDCVKPALKALGYEINERRPWDEQKRLRELAKQRRAAGQDVTKRGPKPRLRDVDDEDEEESGNRKGIHVLRRSGARAMFDALRAEGHDGALQRVREMLHHSSVKMTELYLGVSLEQELLDQVIRGKRMFPQIELDDTGTTENVDGVVALRRA